MPSAWHIVPAARADSAFDGEGARLYGGRWNSQGHAAVYSSGSRALAALEVLVHLTNPPPPIRYQLFEVQFPESLVQEIEDTSALEHLHCATIRPETQILGDTWLQSATSQPVLRIYSAIIPQEANYLLNPRHPKFSRLKIGNGEPFAFDPRLISQ